MIQSDCHPLGVEALDVVYPSDELGRVEWIVERAAEQEQEAFIAHAVDKSLL